MRSGDGDTFRLMELELIEPSLYLRTDLEAPRRFAEALGTRVAAQRRLTRLRTLVVAFCMA